MFIRVCGGDDCGVSRGFFSGNVDVSCQLITKAFYGAKFDLLSIRSINNTVCQSDISKIWFLLIFLKLSSRST